MATKIVKNYFMAVVAMVMIIGFSAFKVGTLVSPEISTTSAKNVRLDFWAFTGDDPEDATNPENYIKASGSPIFCDNLAHTVCYIEAPEQSNGIYPDLDEVVDPLQDPLRTYSDSIEEAMNGTPSTNDVVKSLRSL